MANSGGVYTWSRTGTTNASADSTVNWAEGQPPSSINDSARNMMASAAKWRDDISGAIVTTGTSTAYIVSSYQQFDSLADMDGQMIAFTPHATNGGSPTLNVDGLGGRGIVSASGVLITAGVLIANTPYIALYNNANSEWRLQNFFGNPYNIPIGATLDFWLPTAPNSSFVFPFGQAISRTTYSALFAAMGTTFGTGDGSTTFNLPDLRGRVTACLDTMGGTDAGRLVGGTISNRGALGGNGGEATHQIAASEVPQLSVSVSGGISVASSASNYLQSNSNVVTVPGGTSGSAVGFPNGTVTNLSQVSSTGTASLSGSANTGVTASGHNNVQPTILCNRIMRVI